MVFFVEIFIWNENNCVDILVELGFLDVVKRSGKIGLCVFKGDIVGNYYFVGSWKKSEFEMFFEICF